MNHAEQEAVRLVLEALDGKDENLIENMRALEEAFRNAFGTAGNGEAKL